MFFFFFFFSSRRRHTRCSRDWSSDVCSSDLDELRRQRAEQMIQRGHGFILGDLVKIGRASCRERGVDLGGRRIIKKKKKKKITKYKTNKSLKNKNQENLTTQETL